MDVECLRASLVKIRLQMFEGIEILAGGRQLRDGTCMLPLLPRQAWEAQAGVGDGQQDPRPLDGTSAHRIPCFWAQCMACCVV